jgi:hypothetical protein
MQILQRNAEAHFDQGLGHPLEGATLGAGCPGAVHRQ